MWNRLVEFPGSVKGSIFQGEFTSPIYESSLLIDLRGRVYVPRLCVVITNRVLRVKLVYLFYGYSSRVHFSG